ncbi:MAG: CHAT domain-containing protein [Chloroflexota bacterium]|nr:CHAT domain-containing protein [Chloroflexota bacterium]
MDPDALVEHLLGQPSAVEERAASLPDAAAAAVVEHLKQEADRHWWINANHSLQLAEIIVRLGQARRHPHHTALGLMARGDALKFLGRTEEAWQTLEEAGALFRSAGDEIGWARTRIGRLVICVDLQRVAEALADGQQARAIFTRYHDQEKLLRLDLNTAIVHNLLGDQAQALALYETALATAAALGATGTPYLGALYTNIGNVHDLLGNFREALAYHERARASFAERGEIRGVALAEYNSAHIAMAQGYYVRALQLLHGAHTHYTAASLLLDATNVSRDMVECYLLLNRYAEARDLARQTLATYEMIGAAYQQAVTWLHLATAEAELGQLAAAQTALTQAEAIFETLGANGRVATVRFRRGRVALQQGCYDVAHAEAVAARETFAAYNQQVDCAWAMLLQAQACRGLGHSAAALPAARAALHTAQHCYVPALRYAAHLLLGRLAEASGSRTRARRHYHAAMAALDRVQRGLTITLRPGFLEDKGEALHALLGQQINAGDATGAFETLERAKSQVLLGYLANRERLRWQVQDEQARRLVAELERLREEHHRLYQLAHGTTGRHRSQPAAGSEVQARAELRQRERRMRSITERLYLRNGDGHSLLHSARFSARDVQRQLGSGTLLVEFYNDGTRLWAFTIDHQSLEAHPLPIAARDLDGLLRQLQMNIDAALSVDRAGSQIQGLANLAGRILQRLHAALLGSLSARLERRSRLVIVPYGSLHYLPFHLLHDGSAHLIERCEVVVLPTAALITRQTPRRMATARVLAHSWDGTLPETLVEAQMVHELFGGELLTEELAVRAVLDSAPAQILHIAAHGEQRPDQPDLSYIQLADGQLYTDDLLQHDLSYELVTLSGCETGRSHVAPGDELIGLGRGFLYAGAGSLITSLWQVPDEAARRLMAPVYRELKSGVGKAAALRAAQLSVLHEAPGLHPAFWGAFQLIGDAGPLSMSLDHTPTRENQNVKAQAAI